MSRRQAQLVNTVRARLSADRGFLFDDRSGRVYTLNASAAFMAARLRQPAPLVELVSALTKTFQTDDEIASRGLEHFLEQLVGEGLGRIEEGDGRG